jgi:imidazolonepropionase-like amidohydrolase
MKTAFIHTNLVDVLEGKLIPDCSVIAEDGIIVDIISKHEKSYGPAGTLDSEPSMPPADDLAPMNIVDLKGAYMTPGFFDCHVHIVNDSLPEKLSPKKTPIGYTLTALENLESLAARTAKLRRH